MKSFMHRSNRQLIALLACFLIAIRLDAHSDRPDKTQGTRQGGTVTRVEVSLVQMDVMVFDKQGRFVPDIKKDQFELKIDGKTKPIDFLEVISTGSPDDRKIWINSTTRSGQDIAPSSVRLFNDGRLLLMFLDDIHMTEDSAIRSKNALVDLINTSMAPNDLVGIFAASGKLVGMEALTNEKEKLLSVLKEHNFQISGPQDMGYPQMTEAQAALIVENDYDVIGYFIAAIVGMPVVHEMGTGWKPQTGGIPPPGFLDNCARAETQTRTRAAALAEVAAGFGQRTISALRNLVRSAQALPGRKFVFFLSDGFLLQQRRSNIAAQISDLTTEAARAGIVFYTLDSRGLVTGTPDAKKAAPSDVHGVRARMAANDVSAPWDALNALASDTGGRFLKNTNSLDTALITTLNEISSYYLLGWYVDRASLAPGKYSRLRMSIKGRSDLNVRVRQGLLDLYQLISKDKK